MATRSERAAWSEVRDLVKRILQLTRDAAPHSSSVTKAREAAFELSNLAGSMLDQLGRGIHANPPIVIYGNPPKGGELMSRGKYGVEYKHADDGEDYRHDCSAGVSMYAVPGGGILLQRPDRRPLSREFEV